MLSFVAKGSRHHQYANQMPTIKWNCFINSNNLHTSAVVATFWEPYKSGGAKYEPKKLTNKKRFELYVEGVKGLKSEFKMLKDEWKEKIFGDPPIVLPGESEIVWKFDRLEVLDKFIVASDKDHNEGFSECEFVLNKHNKAVFRGILSTQVPKDGKIQRSGYCAINSMRIRKSFQRQTYLDWFLYSHLLMRVRGDGRSYMINIACEGYFDLVWHDMYNYVLYTRGGPYWQIVKIPFSKFFLSSKGRIQDKQSEIPLSKITRFGIALGDKIPGPFQLEIDYIGVHFDPSHTEKFAYEMYQAPKYTVGV